MGAGVVTRISVLVGGRYLAAGMIGAACVLFSTAVVAEDRPSLPSRVPLSAQLTAMFGLVAGCAIVLGAVYFLRAILRFVRSQQQRASGSTWRGTFNTSEYSQEGRVLLANSLKDIGKCGWMVALAAGAIMGLNRQ